MRRVVCAALVALACAGLATPAVAQGGNAAETPESMAPIDLTGYWVSVVTEDWRWRMRTPPPGDFESVPLNDEGQRVLNQWTTDMDGQCEAYGVGGLMRMPGRLNITWQDPETLRIQTDAGTQERLLHFVRGNSGAPSLQGYSVARWDLTGDGDVEDTGYLAVETSSLTPAWLRRNGVPYSGDATVTEYIDRFTTPAGVDWLSVVTVVTDPAYLTAPFITSTQFKRESDPSKWMPTTCR